jgi:hypothetical protein
MANVRSKRSKTLLKKLRSAKWKANKKLPSDTVEALTEMAMLAAEHVNTRSTEIEILKQQSGQAARKAKDCSKYNTSWNAFLWLIGICDKWTECMNGCKD